MRINGLIPPLPFIWSDESNLHLCQNVRIPKAAPFFSCFHYHPIEFDYEIHEIHETRAGAAAVSSITPVFVYFVYFVVDPLSERGTEEGPYSATH